MNSNIGLSFGSSNSAYRTYRINYPPQLFKRIEAAAPPMQHRLAVDLGSGTGLSLSPLLQRFDHVIAVEPDVRMAEKIPSHDKLEIRVLRSEEFDIDPRCVDLITCATAFYWMDGPLLIERMAGWLHPQGLIAVYRYGFPALPQALNVIIQRELHQHWNAHRSPRLIDEDYSWRCFSESSHLKRVDRAVINNVVSMDSNTLTGFFSSTSYCGAYMRSLTEADAYLNSLHHEISNAAGNTSFDVDFSLELITASI